MARHGGTSPLPCNLCLSSSTALTSSSLIMSLCVATKNSCRLVDGAQPTLAWVLPCWRLPNVVTTHGHGICRTSVHWKEWDRLCESFLPVTRCSSSTDRSGSGCWLLHVTRKLKHRLLLNLGHRTATFGLSKFGQIWMAESGWPNAVTWPEGWEPEWCVFSRFFPSPVSKLIFFLSRVSVVCVGVFQMCVGVFQMCVWVCFRCVCGCVSDVCGCVSDVCGCAGCVDNLFLNRTAPPPDRPHARRLFAAHANAAWANCHLAIFFPQGDQNNKHEGQFSRPVCCFGPPVFGKWPLRSHFFSLDAICLSADRPSPSLRVAGPLSLAPSDSRYWDV